MDQYEKKRQSHCSVCGKRLSEKTNSGEILWHPGNVDDSGIYCANCTPPKKKSKDRKNSRT
jgi:hypothetical protein